MAIQLGVNEVKGCKTYLEWLVEKAGINKNLGRILFEMDFTYDIKEDEIRAKDAVELREVYSKDVGHQSGKDARDVDRIWKSIYGKCSVLELFLKLAVRLDSMVNEEEEGIKVPYFMNVFMKNLGIGNPPEEVKSKKFDRFSEDVHAKITRFLERKYNKNGSNGGIFPLKHAVKDQRIVAVWDQMNAWLDENLDEDCCFMW